MPYQISWDDRATMRVVYSGLTGDRDVLEVIKIQHGDDRFDALRRVLHDFRGIEGCTHSVNTLEEIDCLTIGAWQTNPRFKIAVVADRSDVIDMIKAFEKERLDAYPMKVFSALADARAWLES